jgi:hypothetical protein
VGLSRKVGRTKDSKIFLGEYMDTALGLAIIMVVGLFSVPAPPTRNPCVRRGFFIAVATTFDLSDSWVMWRIDQTQASLNAPGLSARVNLQQPDHGLANIGWHETPVSNARLLQVRRTGIGPRLVDAYVRGADLVACYDYETPSSGSLAAQVYWRYIEYADLGAAGFELIVSVETELLDDDPCLAFGSELPCSELLQAANEGATDFRRVPVPDTAADEPCRCTGVGLFLHRLGAGPFRYLEMAHPADFFAAEFEQGPAPGILRSRFRLFEERLEKGVIRRARARGLLCQHAQNDEAVAQECYRRLLASESPLAA